MGWMHARNHWICSPPLSVLGFHLVRHGTGKQLRGRGVSQIGNTYVVGLVNIASTGQPVPVATHDQSWISVSSCVISLPF